jgi:hypothetical protein
MLWKSPYKTFGPASIELYLRTNAEEEVRVPRRVFQRLLPELPTPERCVEAY